MAGQFLSFRAFRLPDIRLSFEKAGIQQKGTGKKALTVALNMQSFFQFFIALRRIGAT